MQLALLGGTPIRKTKIKPLFEASDETRARLTKFLAGGLLSDFYGGPIAAEFEELFARAHGVKHAVAVSSGTAALHCAVAAAGVGPGDEVLVPTTCFFTAATAVVQQRGVPVLVDSMPETLEIDLDRAAGLVTPRTRAIIVAHMYGYPGDVASMRDFATRHDLVLIEDACQAHGSRRDGSPAGTVGDLGCFSFAAPRKHINTGEGGMVITNDAGYADLARQVSNKGKSNGWYTHRMMGYSYSMPELSALMGIQGLMDLDEEVERRRSAAAEYDRVLRGSELDVDEPDDRTYHSYFRKVVWLPPGFEDLRDWIVMAIEAENVSAKPPHAALHRIPWLSEFSPYPSGDAVEAEVVRSTFPNAEYDLDRILDLETGPGLAADNARESAHAVTKVWEWVRSHPKQARSLAAAAGRYGE